MGIKKKKNIIILTLCMVLCFSLYQLYFFLSLPTGQESIRIIPVSDHIEIKEALHLRSEADKYINNNGIIRGVYYSNMPKYRPDSKNEFKCLVTDQRIPYEYVNDDYCDCEDGSDEPSTNACPKGYFFCDAQFSKLTNFNKVPSGQVNDGICDCCDGSDEWMFNMFKKFVSQANKRHMVHYVTRCPNVC